MSILNPKRLRDYPRLMLFSTWLILGINLLLHQGWIGAFGQVIGGDFIMFYSTGLIYRTNPSMIYDYTTQFNSQQELIAPTTLPGYNPFMNPPFVAPLYSLLTYISLNWAIVIWSLFAIMSVFLSAYWLVKLRLNYRKTPELPYWQLVIIVLSFFPFIEGLQSGQNHWLTLLLITGIAYAMLNEKWYLAGILAGVLIYKPQFVLGFLIIWVIWKKFKALLCFGIVTGIWIGLFTLVNGFGLFRTYLQLNQVFMNLPYIPGFPNYLLVTIYGFLTSVFPQNNQPVLSLISQTLLILCAVGLAWLAYSFRNHGMQDRIPVVVFAILLPLLVTPYALLHDMIIIVPALVLWSISSNSRYVLRASVIIYLGAFLLTFIAALTKVAWVALIVVGLFLILIKWIISKPEPSYEVASTK